MSAVEEDYGPVRLSIEEGIARIELNRPEAANSIDLALAQALMRAAVACDESADARVVLLTGAGKIFCGGGDLKTFVKFGDGLPAYLKEVTAALHVGLSRLTRSRLPVVASVQGAAGGAGFSMACAADIVIAEAGAKFTMSYTRIGLVPDGGSTYFLPRIVGMRKALELSLLNPVLTASEAQALGIVTRVVAPEELRAESEAIVRKLAEGATQSLGATKRLLHSGCVESLETQMELEARAIADAARTADGREGIQAFVEKRPARFRGQG